MGTEGPKLSPGKGRWPKSEAKRAFRRYRLAAATEYKEAKLRHLGTHGAANKGRQLGDSEKKQIEEKMRREGKL